MQSGVITPPGARTMARVTTFSNSRTLPGQEGDIFRPAAKRGDVDGGNIQAVVRSSRKRPMATVVVGGLASTLLLTFLALPSLCYLMKRKSESAKFAD